jgi:FtsZ-binding cell division protein ZapB
MPSEAVYEPTEAEVLAAVERLKLQREKRNEYQRKRNELIKQDPSLADKVREARRAYNKSEAALARRKKYYETNKEKIREMHKRYHEKQRALLAKAKEMGLI